MNPPHTRLVLGILVGALVLLGGLILVVPVPASLRPTASPTLGAGPVGSSSVRPAGEPSPSVAAPESPSPPSPPASIAPASLAPASPPVPLSDIAIVPVTSFRSTRESASAADVRASLAGDGRFKAIELVAAEADAILAALGVDRPADPALLVLVPDAAALAADMAKNLSRLGFLRADAIDPSVRALAWEGAELFGVDRVVDPASWPLMARLPDAGTGGPAPFDPAATWTLVAGGDILLDRGVAQTVTVNGKGVDFPFDGGTAEITGHTCCSSFGWEQPVIRRTGNKGAVRHLIETADVAVANFENPAPDNFRYHTRDTVFSADPKLIEGLANAGIDAVSLANNHIGDFGRNAVIQTRRNVEEWGIATAGAGRNLAEARKPAILDGRGTKVAILGYDTIAPGYAAGADRPGSALLSARAVEADVAAARRAGAEVVVVYPHWGAEYDPTPFPAQQRLARAVIDAGADMVIGNHAHWAGAMEIYEGRPIWYALGNFVFDQTWSEPTMEGLLLELTFHGPDLVQVRLHPHIILDKAQPNFLDPAGDGKVVLNQVYGASKGLLDW